jgi:DNA-binding HxlR family transcriptional regulator
LRRRRGARWHLAPWLETDGILARRVMPTSPPTVEYSLTDLGRELIPAIEAIVQVGHKLKRRRNKRA